MNLNESNLIEIKLIPKKPKEKYSLPIFKLSITNLDNFLSEKLIAKNIPIMTLFYKTIIEVNEKNLIPSQKDIFLYNKYIPGDKTIITELTNNEEKIILDQSKSYKISVFLVSKIDKFEEVINKSNQILFNPKIGLLNNSNNNFQSFNKKSHSLKKLFSKSEKDNIKFIKAATTVSGLENILKDDDIKRFTYEGRDFENIEQFLDSRYKVSKLLTDERKKKIIFSTQSKIHFDEKMLYENEKKNPFLKNEWFMGPIYSYDYNYEKYI